MIHGIGIDIIEIDRIGQSIERFGERFLSKIFTPNEIRHCTAAERSDRHFATIFAAKEALSKAMATGNSGNFGWRNVEVVYDETGRPGFRLFRSTESALHGRSVLLSLSFSETLVVASAVIVQP